MLHNTIIFNINTVASPYTEDKTYIFKQMNIVAFEEHLANYGKLMRKTRLFCEETNPRAKRAFEGGTETAPPL